MFEREADLAETEMLINCNGDYSKKKNYREGWQEGATFGYNKAKEELEAQIEKMKCCRNCKKLDNRKVECSEGSDLIYFFGKNCDKWEIKENE